MEERARTISGSRPGGDEPLVVLLPGLHGGAELFPALQRALADRLETRVITLPRELASYEELEDRLAPELPGDRDFILLGESFSGPLAVRLAARAPEGLRGLVLAVSFLRTPRRGLALLAPLVGLLPIRLLPLRWLARLQLGRFARPGLAEALEQARLALPARTLVARLRAIAAVDVRSIVARLDVPVLALVARQDRHVPGRAMRDLATARATARIVRIDGPHFLLQAQPEACADILVDFARSAGRVPES